MNRLKNVYKMVKKSTIAAFALPICCALLITPNTSFAQCPSCASFLPPISVATAEMSGDSDLIAEATQQSAQLGLWQKGKKTAMIAFLGLLGGIAAAEAYFNEAMKQSTTGATMHKWGDKNTNDNSPNNMKKVYGSKSPFASLVSAYKEGDQTCSKKKGSSKKQCYSNLNAGTIQNHNKFKDKNHKKAAENYSKNAAGGAIGISKPNKKWKSTPSSVKYNAYYKTQSSVGSKTTNSSAGSIGQRQTVKKNGKKSSQLGQQDKGNREHVQKQANKMSGVPVVGSLFGIQANTQKISPQMHQQSKKLNSVNSSVNGTNTHFAHANHQAFGKQMHQDAKNQSQGEPHKKHPHE